LFIKSAMWCRHTRVAYIRIASREDGYPLWGGHCSFETSLLSCSVSFWGILGTSPAVLLCDTGEPLEKSVALLFKHGRVPAY
jgi:hypothetical protein